MIINTTRKDLFYTWLWYLDPIFKLQAKERELLSGFIGMHYTNRHKYSDISILNEFLFSLDSTKKLFMKRYNLTEEKYDKIFERLKSRGFLQEYKVDQGEGEKTLLRLNPYITKYPKNEKFEIHVQLNIVE